MYEFLNLYYQDMGFFVSTTALGVLLLMCLCGIVFAGWK